MILTQGKMSVLKYEKQFTTLSQFTTTFVQTNETRCKNIQWGLNYSIWSRLSSFELTNYVTIVNEALVVEKDVQELVDRREQFKRGDLM